MSEAPLPLRERENAPDPVLREARKWTWTLLPLMPFQCDIWQSYTYFKTNCLLTPSLTYLLKTIHDSHQSLFRCYKTFVETAYNKKAQSLHSTIFLQENKTANYQDLEKEKKKT